MISCSYCDRDSCGLGNPPSIGWDQGRFFVAHMMWCFPTPPVWLKVRPGSPTIAGWWLEHDMMSSTLNEGLHRARILSHTRVSLWIFFDFSKCRNMYHIFSHDYYSWVWSTNSQWLKPSNLTVFPQWDLAACISRWLQSLQARLGQQKVSRKMMVRRLCPVKWDRYSDILGPVFTIMFVCTYNRVFLACNYF